MEGRLPVQASNSNQQPTGTIESKRSKEDSISDGNGNENLNVTRKYNFISFVLLHDYFNSLNF